MEEHSIDTDKFTSVWIPSYGSDSGFYEATPKTDLDYDIHQYTSKGKIAGFDHDLDINVISALKNKEETFRKLFLKPLKAFVYHFVFLFLCLIVIQYSKDFLK